MPFLSRSNNPLGKAPGRNTTVRCSKLLQVPFPSWIWAWEPIVSLRTTDQPSCCRGIQPAEHSSSEAPNQSESLHSNDLFRPSRGAPVQARRFRSLQAIYLKPLKRVPKYGIPSCDLQLRSYSVRNVEFFADFALRAAYYLNLPALGPVPLPRIVERWTVPRSNFIFKKSQENFERITMRRLIQIQDGDADTVELWLAFLRKYQYYGIGMKANMWQFEPLGLQPLSALIPG